MTLYLLESIVSEHSHGGLVNLNDSARIHKLFTRKDASEKEFNELKIHGVSQKEIWPEELKAADYVKANTGGVLLFSERMENIFSNCPDIDFHRCNVRFSEGELLFFAGRITNFTRLFPEFHIDKMYNSYLEKIPEDFYVARDVEQPSMIVYSQKFIDICLEEKARIIARKIDKKTGKTEKTIAL